MDWLLATIWYLIGVWASTWLARRLLGQPVPLARALGATLLGLVTGLAGAALVGASNPGRELYAVDFTAISFLTTLVLVALLGLLARPQHPGTARPTIGAPHPLRALRRRGRGLAATPRSSSWRRGMGWRHGPGGTSVGVAGSSTFPATARWTWQRRCSRPAGCS
jgi:hypothetical protein